MLGDLSLDRLGLARNEGKLYFKPTRIQKIGEQVGKTLIDVNLTNLPDGFTKSSVFDPGLSDHALVYAFIKGWPNQKQK